MSKETEFVEQNKNEIYVLKDENTTKYFFHFEMNGKINIKCRIIYINNGDSSKYVHIYDENTLYLMFYENKWMKTTKDEMKKDLEDFQVNTVDFVNEAMDQI